MTGPERETESALHQARELELAALVEAFLEARRKDPGSVTVEAWLARYPDHARELAELLPSLILMESIGGEASEVAARRDLQVAIPDSIGEYRILRRLGRGGMGIVYLAEQASLGRQVALKVLPTGLELDHGFVERFHREARAAARLLHPHIVPVFGAGYADGQHYFAMRYVDGASLEERLRGMRTVDPAGSTDDRPFTVSEAVQIASEVASAVAHAHAGGVLHRDIKPGNVLLDAEGRAWVTDFGLCRLEDGGHLTSDGAILGTLRYMAPEQIDGASDERSDVYGVGLLLFELLTLRPAFDSVKRAKIVHDVLHSPLPRLRRIRPDVPRALETVVNKAAAKLPQERYASAAALYRDLEAFLQDRPISARPPSALYLARLFVSRHRLATVVAAVAVCLLGLLGALYVRDLRESEARSERRAYAGDLAAAEAALRDGATLRARFHLDQAPAALRSWEWAHLDARIDQSIRSVLLADGPLYQLAVRPEGRGVAVASSEGISIASLPGLEAVAQIRCGATRAVAWDPAGERLIAARYDGRLDAYAAVGPTEFEQLGQTRIPMDRTRRPTCLTVVDGVAIVGTGEGDVLAWDPALNELTLLDVLSGDIVAVGPLEVALDGGGGPVCQLPSAFWAASTDGDFVVYRGRDREGAFRLQLGSRHVADVDLDSTGYGVLAAEDGSVRDFHLPPRPSPSQRPTWGGVWQTVPTAFVHSTGATLRAIHLQGRIAAAVGRDKVLHLVDLEDRGELRALSGSPHPLTDVAFVEGTRMILTTGEDGWLRSWDRAVAGGGVALRGHLNDVNSSAFSPDGRQLVTGGRDGVVIVWDLERGEPIEVFTEPISMVLGVGFLGPQGDESIFGATASGRYFRWDPDPEDPTGRGRRLTKGTAGARVHHCLRHDRTGEVIVATSSGLERIGRGALDEGGGGEFAPEVRASSVLEKGRDITSLDILPLDGSAEELICLTRTGEVLAIDLASFATVRELETGFRPASTQLSVTAAAPSGRSGSRVARGVFITRDREVVLFDVETGETEVLFASRSSDGALGETPMEAAWTAGGERILVTTRNGLMSVWDPDNAEHLVDLRGHPHWAMRLEACPSTGWIVSLAAKSGVRIWNTEGTAAWSARLDQSVPLVSEATRATAVQNVTRGKVLDRIRASLESSRGRIPNAQWMLVASLYRIHPDDVQSEALYTLARARFERSPETLARVEYCLAELADDPRYAPLLERCLADLWDVAAWRDAHRGRASMDGAPVSYRPPEPWRATHRAGMVHAPFALVSPLRTQLHWIEMGLAVGRFWRDASSLDSVDGATEGLRGLPRFLARFRAR